MNVKLTYVRLLVDDFRDSLRFYRDTLGMKSLNGDLNSHYAEFEGMGVRLALFQRSAMSDAIGVDLPAGSHGNLALVLEVEDVDAAFKDLEGRGVKFVLGPRTHEAWGVRSAHLRDPDGNLIEINQKVSQDKETLARGSSSATSV